MEHNLPGHTYDFKVLLRVYIALLVLAGGMMIVSLLPVEAVAVDWIDLHVLKGLVILGIAIAMIAVAAGFLMGLKYETSRLNTLVFLGNFAFLALFITFVWADVNFRGLLDPSFEKQINWESPVLKANETASGEPVEEPAEDDVVLDEEDYTDEASEEDPEEALDEEVAE